jgi:hypothetical protein
VTNLHDIEHADPTELAPPIEHAPASQNGRCNKLVKQSDGTFRFEIAEHVDGVIWNVDGVRSSFEDALQASQDVLRKIYGPRIRVSVSKPDGSIVYAR